MLKKLLGRRKKGHIFCRHCQYIRRHKAQSNAVVDDCYVYTCRHPNNIKRETHHLKSWFTEKTHIFVSLDRKPRDINRNNDCPWFRPRIEDPKQLELF